MHILVPLRVVGPHYLPVVGGSGASTAVESMKGLIAADTALLERLVRIDVRRLDAGCGEAEFDLVINVGHLESRYRAQERFVAALQDLHSPRFEFILDSLRA